MRIYLGVCCLNRPFDHQSQHRIRLESEALWLTLVRTRGTDLTWVTSEAVDFEVGRRRDGVRRDRIRELLAPATVKITLSPGIKERQAAIQSLGFTALDALHLSCAEAAGVDVFLSTDDRLVRLALRSMDHLEVLVENPLTWLTGEVQ